VEGDCLEAAIWLKHEKKLNPCVLNMASSSNPGGGWKKGSAAQEENLHRRSNLFMCLEDPYKTCKRSWDYPIPEFGGIYSPDVFIFRASEDQGYQFLSHAERISIVSVSAYKSPPLDTRNDETVLSKSIVNDTKHKMETILNIALDNHNDSIVLSAFGCGAYGNPPNHIAELFREVINSKFKKSFKVIMFAIFDDKNTYKAHNPKGNYLPFVEKFQVEHTPLSKLVALSENKEYLQEDIIETKNEENLETTKGKEKNYEEYYDEEIELPENDLGYSIE